MKDIKLYDIFDRLFTALKKTFNNILYPIFSSWSYIYAYLRVDFSEDEHHTFAQNMDIVKQRS